ncbi:uncharacterized protein LOC126260821 [Schistocerca nitens]|uniref:uncharacterized protein LOC126260821 n=1 Tax=Schistocerca nitens TaxID=7011 RepID=UPI002117C04E|nr:uncharacterized protein LOC126260821 [Schistocerca nitens]
MADISRGRQILDISVLLNGIPHLHLQTTMKCMAEDSVWSLQKYAKLENGSWVQVDGNGNLDLIKQGLQLLVVHQGTGLDSITLNSNPHQLKGFWKGSTLAIAIKYKLTTRRIKFKFAATKNHSSVMNCGACVHMLKNYMHITDNTGTAQQETLQVTELYEYILKANSIERPLVPGTITNCVHTLE